VNARQPPAVGPRERGPRYVGDTYYALRRWPYDQWAVTADSTVIYGPTKDYEAALREYEVLTT
jgi:hypothetical protein